MGNQYAFNHRWLYCKGDGNWRSPGPGISNLVDTASKCGNYLLTSARLVINYVAPENAAGGTFTVNFGSQALTGTVKAGAPQIASPGRVLLQPGAFEIKIAATKIVGWN